METTKTNLSSAKDAPSQTPSDAPVIEPTSVARRTMGGVMGGALQFGVTGAILGVLCHVFYIGVTAGFGAVTLPGVLGIAALGAVVLGGVGLVSGGLIAMVKGVANRVGQGKEQEGESPSIPMRARTQAAAKEAAVSETKDIQTDLAQQQQALNQQKTTMALSNDPSEVYHDPTNKPPGYWQQKVRPNRAPQLETPDMAGSMSPSPQ